jgi:cyclopropane fatty-acyl-phospholipid synthase-like methyltransferase
MVDDRYQRDWPVYFDHVGHLGPRETLMLALDSHGPVDPASPPVALDVGCGEGRDTRAMLSRGWRVIAFDASHEGLTRLRARTDPSHEARLSTHLLTLEEAATSPLLPPRVDLVNASFSLPFCDPDAFPSLWTRLRSMLSPSGLFAGQVFGDRDDWAKIRPRSHYTRKAMHSLFDGFELLRCEEVEKDGSDAMGGVKHHHLFHIVARLS